MSHQYISARSRRRAFLFQQTSMLRLSLPCHRRGSRDHSLPLPWVTAQKKRFPNCPFESPLLTDLRGTQFQMVCERPPAAFGGSPPREGETRAERVRGSLTHHLELILESHFRLHAIPELRL